MIKASYDTLRIEKLRKIFCVAVLFFTVSWSYAQESKKAVSPKTYISYFIDQTIVIDGLGTEESWEKVKPTEAFIDIEGVKTPKFKTTLKMLWDQDYIYFLAEMEEPHVWGNLKERDTIIFYNNDFEIFIDPDDDTHNYYEFEINALNTLWDLFITKPYREGTPVLNDWDANGLKSAVKINGTLNNPSDIDKGWTLEIAIPFKVFKTSYYHKNTPNNTFWRVNFSRVNWDFELQKNSYQRKKNNQGKFESEYNWVWSPMGVINMHQPENWGYVYFSSKKAGELDIFKIPEDQKVKQFLYSLYRKQKEFYKKNNRWATTFNEFALDDQKIDGNKVIRTIENHQTGFNITVVSPYTNRLFIIKEDGKIIQKVD
ncbi:carbohydrate-binding family 9-like protein [Aquimarina sp. AU474]|uniref:carbohydrate-binding family 9-like protein n=1 Tax=Aquimarina sp. AU474 TaxID=2108529 RepID=UPI000D686166|nr:carbohydrate-binding family 9-like protein [Aquimarina sp. AU474]